MENDPLKIQDDENNHQNVIIQYEEASVDELEERVAETNKFWRDVNLEFNKVSFNEVILSQDKALNLADSIFKLGQIAGAKSCRKSLKIKTIDKAVKIDVDYGTEYSNKIKISTEFGVVEVYRGILQDADSYIFRKITDRFEGVFKIEIEELLLSNLPSMKNKRQRIGYVTVEGQLFFFNVLQDKLNVLSAYKISVYYE